MMTLIPPRKHQRPKTAIQIMKPVAPKILPLKYRANGKAKQRKKKRKLAQRQERSYDFCRNASSSSAVRPFSMGGGMSSTSGSFAARCFHLKSVSGAARLPAIATKPEKQMETMFENKKGSSLP